MDEQRQRFEAWKAGNELLPFHPLASHVSPDYRDGWNACYRAWLAAQPQWQPIESAPKDGSKIILAKFGFINDTGDAKIDSPEWYERIWDNTRRKYAFWWSASGFWSDRFSNWNDGVEPSGFNNPTHWMPQPPIPSPPSKRDVEAEGGK